ncbi:LANO_0E04654g1_1 [Lachancea nothofagi CBS 11611]|uniref:LANO_0E04654g1_1 n=1 Tax=Lachancea nothofagi CBS 11611 TaxID=1266666 RepID=A0A1G4JS94_9SACH|nr:LANO_0E04654g1_1 [Lachancea nothofagi CBS 11611]
MFWSSKSGISSNYSYSSSPTFTVEPWNVHTGRSKSNSSSSSTSRVSVFIFDKRHFENHLLTSGIIKSRSSTRDKQFIQSAYDILRAQVNQLAKIKHPNVLALIEPLEEHSKNFIFVAEYVTGNLESSIMEGNSGDDSDVLELSQPAVSGDVVTQRGILQISQGLDFIHNRANSVLLDLRPATVLVNENSDWKISGLGHLTKLPPGSNTGQYTPDFNPNFPAFMHIPLSYSAPELILENMLTPKNDYFALGLLIYFLYYKRDLFTCQNYIGDYKKEFSKYEKDLLQLSYEKYFSRVPQKLRFSMSKLMNRDVFSRYDNINEFLEIEFFQDPLVKTLAFLDDLPTKDSKERSIYLNGLLEILPQFPPQLLQRKFLPILLQLLDQVCSSDAIDEQSLNTLVTVISKIGATLSQLSFQEKVYPHLVSGETFGRLLEHATASLIENVDIFQRKIKSELFTDKVLKPLCMHVFSKVSGEAAVPLQVSFMEKLDIILKAFDFPTVKNFLFDLLSKLFVKTTSLTVKSACVDSFRTMIDRRAVDKFTCVDSLLPLFKAMKTRDPRILMKTLELFRLFPGTVQTEEVLVEQLLPLLWDLSMAMTLKPTQFSEFTSVINKISTDLQVSHLEKLKVSTGKETNFDKVIEKPIRKTEDPDLQASHKIGVPAMLPKIQKEANTLKPFPKPRLPVSTSKPLPKPTAKAPSKLTTDSHVSTLTPRTRTKAPSRPLVLTKGAATASVKSNPGFKSTAAPEVPLRRDHEDFDDFDDFVSSAPSTISANSTNTSSAFPPGFSMSIQPQKFPAARQNKPYTSTESSSLL